MKYKVQGIKIIKRYSSVVVEANNRHEALKKAKSLSQEDLEEIEVTNHSQWDVRRDWNLLDFLFNRG